MTNKNNEILIYPVQWEILRTAQQILERVAEQWTPGHPSEMIAKALPANAYLNLFLDTFAPKR